MEKLSKTSSSSKQLPHYYNIDVEWSEARKGIMCSPELNSVPQGSGCIEVATPPEFPEGIPGIWSPEHLFTASVSTCLMTTFLAIAANSKLNFSGFHCSARGKLDKEDRRIEMTEIKLFPRVVINREEDYARCERVLKKAKDACLISNSIKSKIEMDYTIEISTKTAELED